MKNENLDFEIVDMLMDRPKGFSVANRQFCFYPQTLGKRMLIARLLKTIGIDTDRMKLNPAMEILRVYHEHPRECCRIVAYSTLKSKDDILDEHKVEEIENYMGHNLEADDVITIMSVALSEPDLNAIKKHLGLLQEEDRKRRVINAKESKNTFTFGGRSVYGSLIDFACERYGWTFDYVVWEISVSNLEMLMADKVDSIYLTDDERKKVKMSNDRNVIKADDPEQMKKILSMNWD